MLQKLAIIFLGILAFDATILLIMLYNSRGEGSELKRKKSLTILKRLVEKHTKELDKSESIIFTNINDIIEFKKILKEKVLSKTINELYNYDSFSFDEVNYEEIDSVVSSYINSHVKIEKTIPRDTTIKVNEQKINNDQVDITDNIMDMYI